MVETPPQVLTMPESNIRLIALDLDGTLLNTNKELSPRNAAALERAAAQGVEIVPTTGRFFTGMPEVIQKLPYLHYAITINGAQVYDIARDCAVARTEMPVDLALRIMEYLDRQPVVYDCYQENWGYMTRDFQLHIDDFTPDPHYREMVRRLRTPVPELKAWLKERNRGVQKIQLFTPDPELRKKLLKDLAEEFPEAAVTSSVPTNIEINAADAHKGRALQQLADYLGLDISQTAAFGDGLNDVTMLRQAGLGVAMANAWPEALAAADVVTASCDEDGVARELEKLGF